MFVANCLYGAIKLHINVKKYKKISFYILKISCTIKCYLTLNIYSKTPLQLAGIITMSDFVHLHCHTEYSLLDGAIRINDLCNMAKDHGMQAAAITDHGNLFGAISFYKSCQDVGIKPIIGCEVYICQDHLGKDTQYGNKRHHLILLAQNNIGYHNLVRLVSRSFTHGFYRKPRIDKILLEKYSEGIICLSACIAGEIPQAILKLGLDEALKITKEYAHIFPNRFYLELQSNGLAEQVQVNTGLLEIAEKIKLPIVATNDCHYLTANDIDAHDLLLCIQTQKTVDDPKRLKFNSNELYYKSTEEMEKAFGHLPEALANTQNIADLCNVSFTFGKHYFPNYQLAENVSAEDEFCKLARVGLEKRMEQHLDKATIDHALYKDRLELELKIIVDMGFSSYFLIVQDFINWAKNNNIPVGPGRGSAAGSLVAWSLRITNLDPIPYNLLFERFLNSERVSLPDIDVDFCERKRADVIKYVSSKYGEDSVAQIITFGKMKAKAVIRDVGRALGMTFAETDYIAKLIPDDLNITLTKALKAEPRLSDLYKKDEKIKKLIGICLRLEGSVRHASTHAAGIVISDKPMQEYLPLYKGKKGEIITQFDMKIVEKIGLVKFDFLGLKTMTLIQDTLDAIGRQGKKQPDLDNLPLNDSKTYELYSKGETDGIFQVESSGMRQYLRQLKPNCFEDIIAMLALYRPGPLGSGMVDEFIKRKHKLVKVKYPHPSLEVCLKDTYGVIVYQEQVMQIAQIIAQYTLGGADLLRRAMGKKNAEAMANERSKFVEGAKNNQIDSKTANDIFNLMEKFAEYGFNKSHSAAYALISYHTAYLKTHYKVEFLAALLTSEMGNQDKLLKYFSACKDMGITISQANVNYSFKEFTPKDNNIIFGLGAVKNVGDEAIKDVLEARASGGEFSSFYDFACRISLRKVTKRVFESFIKAGAFDCFKVTRAALYESIENVVARASRKAKEKNSGQISLLSMTTQAPEVKIGGIGFDCPEQEIPEWSSEEILKFEKDVLGFFLSSHPLTPYEDDIKRLGLLLLKDIKNGPASSANSEVNCAVLVTSIKEVTTKKSKKQMAFVEVEDLSTSVEVIFFPEEYAKAKEVINSGQTLLLNARIDKKSANDAQDESPSATKLLGQKVMSLADACAQSNKPFLMYIPATHLNEEKLLSLKMLLNKYQGAVQTKALVQVNGLELTLQLGHRYNVLPCPQLSIAFKDWAAQL